jgi:hypothetical protein
MNETPIYNLKDLSKKLKISTGDQRNGIDDVTGFLTPRFYRFVGEISKISDTPPFG